jgi:hypothetical protein
MTADAFEEVEAILSAAVEAELSERPLILDARCHGRPNLRAEVESLLAALGAANGFLEDAGAVEARGAAPEDTRPGVGTSIGSYRLVEVIGEGGMGKVFRAERADGEFSHQIAIKIIAAPDASDVRRFRAERQILATLQHPHIVTLLDGGTLASGHAYLAMEYVRGQAITAYCRERQLGLDERLRLESTRTLPRRRPSTCARA